MSTTRKNLMTEPAVEFGLTTACRYGLQIRFFNLCDSSGCVRRLRVLRDRIGISVHSAAGGAVAFQAILRDNVEGIFTGNGGAVTAILRGKGGATGVGVVELYKLQ